MKIKPGFDMRKVCGEHIIIAHGVKNIDFTKVITLNESAAMLWESVKGRDFTEAELVDALLEVYEVERPRAEEDVKEMLAQWREVGLVE